MEVSDPNDDNSFKRGRPPVRNWDLWLVEDKVVTLFEGVDFACTADSIRQQAYKKAEQRGGVAKVKYKRDSNNKAVVKIFFTRQTEVQRVPAAEVKPREDGHLTNAEIDELYYRIHPEEQQRTEEAPVVDPDPRLRLPDLDDDGDFVLDIPDAPSLIDDPTSRNGRKWGPPN